jgi:hypothetical protein
MDDCERFFAKDEDVSINHTFVGRRGGRQAELGEKLSHLLMPEKIGVSSMHDNIGSGSILKQPVAANMIGMPVCVDDISDREIFLLAGSKDILLVAAGVNNHSFPGIITGHYITADPHHANRHLFNTHSVS